MKTIGISGGIGSGKTTCCKKFEDLGIPVYYADSRAKQLMISDVKLKRQIKKLLGQESYHSNGRPNRPYIASKIFTDKALLKKMNGLVHPAVGADVITWVQQQSAVYVLYEAALLVENGSYKNFDKLIVVTCPLEERIRRVMKRDKISKEHVVARMKNQLPEKKKIAVADFIIDNSGEIDLNKQIMAIHKKLL